MGGLGVVEEGVKRDGMGVESTKIPKPEIAGSLP